MKTVLIADDDSSVRRVVRATLEGEQLEILEASDGEAALRVVRERRPDLVLLDVMMPKMSGFEVCQQIKRDPETRAVPVVMLTVRSAAGDFDRGADADDYFTKPFSPLALMRKVGELLEPSGT